jgi:hypothetical protein
MPIRHASDASGVSAVRGNLRQQNYLTRSREEREGKSFLASLRRRWKKILR